MITVEIACNGLTSCLNAIKGGADRIELIENLADGGCTPSPGMIRKAKSLVLPVYVMIRPKAGHFSYSHDEIDIMLHDIEYCKEIGVAGLAFGCLTRNGEVDKELNKRLLTAWNGPVTFHRAIDRTNDMIKAAKTICDLGFERILSSGGTANVMNGLEMLKRIQENVGAHIKIMPGAGVTPLNAKQILSYTGCTEIHATCKRILTFDAVMGNAHVQDTEMVSDEDEVRELIQCLK